MFRLSKSADGNDLKESRPLLMVSHIYSISWRKGLIAVIETYSSCFMVRFHAINYYTTRCSTSLDYGTRKELENALYKTRQGQLNSFGYVRNTNNWGTPKSHLNITMHRSSKYRDPPPSKYCPELSDDTIKLEMSSPYKLPNTGRRGKCLPSPKKQWQFL